MSGGQNRTSSRRFRGLVFLLLGLVAAALIVYVVVDPTAFDTLHPFPLAVILAVTALVALWQAWMLLR